LKLLFLDLFIVAIDLGLRPIEVPFFVGSCVDLNAFFAMLFTSLLK
jgi:hypothetical protein